MNGTKINIEIENTNHIPSTLKDAIRSEIEKREEMAKNGEWSESWIKANQLRIDDLWRVYAQL